MIRRMFIITPIFTLFVLAFNCSKTETTEEPIGESIKFIQLINIRPDADEAALINIFNEFNGVIAELGHKNIKYQIWKIKNNEEKEKKYTYLIEVTWPDQTTRSTIENSKQYQAIIEKYGEFMAMTIIDLYNQHYVPVN